MSEALIQIDYGNRVVLATAAAERIKDEALSIGALIGKVTNAEENTAAVEAQVALATVIKQIEQARVACKDPVLELGKKIDGLAKSMKEELTDELTRVSTLVGDFKALEEAKIRAAEAARRLEEERIEREKRAELERIAEEARAKQRKLDEEQRQADEAARKAKTAKAKEEAEARQLEIDRQRELAEATSHKQLEATQEKFNARAQDLPRLEPTKADGQRVTQDWEIQVTDIHALYRAHPTCCKIEPLNSQIKSLLNAGVRVIGINAKRVTKASVRLPAQREAIDV